MCKALGLKVPDWDACAFDEQRLFVEDLALPVAGLVQCARLGIPHGRDEQLPYRFVDAAFVRHCTRNPMRRGQVADSDFHLLPEDDHR
jgi:DNA-3-methyladenine glycosylase